MRQNAVSSAPQNEALTHTLVATATMPTVVDDVSRRRTPSPSVLSAADGKSRLRSASTDDCSSSERSTRPATNSATSASGKIDSSRL
jgi:hypothetical protein